MTLNKAITNILICTFALGVLSACGIGSSTSGSSSVKTTGINKNEDAVGGKLAGPKGINGDSLFNDKVKNSDERFARLENAVQSISNSLNTHLPAIEKLAAIEGDIQELVEQLQTLVNEPDVTAEPLAHITSQNPALAAQATPNAPAPQAAEPAPKKDEIVPAKAPSAPITATSGTNNIRVSQSADKTRVVLDTPKKIDYKLDYDAQENVIFISGKNVDFTALEAAAKKSKHIRTITSSKDGDTTNIVFELQGASSVSAGKTLPPGGGNSNHRYYFDIF